MACDGAAAEAAVRFALAFGDQVESAHVVIDRLSTKTAHAIRERSNAGHVLAKLRIVTTVIIILFREKEHGKLQPQQQQQHHQLVKLI